MLKWHLKFRWLTNGNSTVKKTPSSNEDGVFYFIQFSVSINICSHQFCKERLRRKTPNYKNEKQSHTIPDLQFENIRLVKHKQSPSLFRQMN